ncbi:pca operon transcription factor PcaQ [Roseobacter sp.]|uniref:pca operon transcription factor PcaQ n=1 Tax=Roseobacter sp. TaxID=1907202 RepID=UPI0032988587
MDRRIKFRHLDAFSAGARARSFKAAAVQLNLTQPAISKTLKDLEDILGVAVMTRSRSGVDLTPQGEIFLQFAEQSTAALRHGLRSLDATSGAFGQLKVGALPSVASSLLPDVVSDFAAQSPHTVVQIYEAPHLDLTNRLRAGELDVVVGRLGMSDTMLGLSFQQLYSEDVVVVARPDSPAQQIQNSGALAEFRVLYPPKDAAIRPLVARSLIAQGVPLFSNRIEVASTAFGRAATLANPDTVWVVSRGVVAQDLADECLVALPSDIVSARGAIGIMSRAKEAPSTAAVVFTTLLHDRCEHPHDVPATNL